MKILVIGSGGREHSLVWRLRQSRSATKIYCVPGNPGTAAMAENVPLKVDDFNGILNFVKSRDVDLTIVGPEYPLSLGIVDLFEENGLKIFGPRKAAAELEVSKSFAKEIMISAAVPTARYECFSDALSAANYIANQPCPIVLKADGLAAGKGVVIAESIDQAQSALKFIFSDLKSERVVIEQFLKGREASLIVATDGTRVVPMVSCHDYKRLRDAQKGPNTGGMGTVSPSAHISAAQEQWAISNIIEPVLKEMQRRGTPFRGFLYAGLMISDDGAINVIEFNSRMGDPECQSLMRRYGGDLAQLLFVLAGGAGQLPDSSWSSGAAVCVVLAAAGYPESPVQGDEIFGLELASAIPGVVIFQAGTSLASGKLVTAGGRVLNVTAIGSDLNEARARAYRAADMVQFRGVQFRRDIGV